MVTGPSLRVSFATIYLVAPGLRAPESNIDEAASTSSGVKGGGKERLRPTLGFLFPLSGVLGLPKSVYRLGNRDGLQRRPTSRGWLIVIADVLIV